MVDKAESKAKIALMTIILAMALWGSYQVYHDFLHPISLNTVSLNMIQQLQCRWAAEGAVRQILKAPSPVSFHYDKVKPPHHNQDGSVTVEGYVKAPKKLGTQMGHSFKVLLSETFNDVISADISK